MQSKYIHKKNLNKSGTLPSSNQLRSPRFGKSFNDHNKTFNANDSFRSEITGIDESKLLMKSGVGRFSRLERFRMRTKNNVLRRRGKTNDNIRKNNFSNSVFGSVSNKQNQKIESSIYIGCSNFLEKPEKNTVPIKLSRFDMELEKDDKPKELLSFSNIPNFETLNKKKFQQASPNNQNKINNSRFSDSLEKNDSEYRDVYSPSGRTFDPFNENFGNKLSVPNSENTSAKSPQIFSFDHVKDSTESQKEMFKYKTVIIKEESQDTGNSVKTDRLRMSELMSDNIRSATLGKKSNKIMMQSLTVENDRLKSKCN